MPLLDSFSFDGHYCLVLRLMDGTLFDSLQRAPEPPPPAVALQTGAAFAVSLMQPRSAQPTVYRVSWCLICV